MQELTSAPQMASPYTPAGGSNMPALNAQQPKLGTPIPGTTGGLAAKPGLNVYDNPLSQPLQSNPEQPTSNPQAQQSAQHTQSFGRGDDSMLVHMTPDEVNSLRGLAQQFGGDLTTNPNTGLPEAGWLGNLLPTLLGGIGMAFGIPPIWMGALGAAGGTAVTGDLGKGLMMGLQAFGGASMAGGLGLTGKISSNALGLLGGKAATTGAALAEAGVPAFTVPVDGGPMALGGLGGAATGAVAPAFTVPVDGGPMALGGLGGAATGAGNASSGFFSNFANAAKTGLPGGIISKAAPMLAAQGVLGGLGSTLQAAGSSGGKGPNGSIDNAYQGPYYSQKREFIPTSTADLLSSSKERSHLTNIMPEIYNSQGQLVYAGSSTAPGTPIVKPVLNPNAKKGQDMYSFTMTPWMQEAPPVQQPEKKPSWMGYAKGGELNMRDGSFVVDARTVSELGNGSSNAGKEILARMGGHPLDGPGDGVSDSIPARIGGKQEARVARDEVVMPPEAVKRMGGTKKLYALMDKAHKARKHAARGQDTKLAKGLGAL